MKKLIIITVMGFWAVSCSDSSVEYSEAEINKEFNIRVSEYAVIPDEGLLIKFAAVNEDSRCPEGAVCVWEGNATVVLELKNSNGDMFTANLNTSLEPKDVQFSGMTISLKELAPYPKLNESIDPKDYFTKLLVTK